jgi:hypothetical protein
MQAKAEFKVTKWDQTEFSDVGDGPAWARATVLKTFTGGLEGESRAELLLAGKPEEGAGYIAQERFVGRLGDRAGSFDLQHGGAAWPDGTTSHQFGYVVPHSGMGELKGLNGTLVFRHDEAGAVFTLESEFLP